MKQIHVVMTPIVADNTLRAPAAYKFSRVMIKDYTKWMEFLTSTNDFEVTPQYLYQVMIRTLIAGYFVHYEGKLVACEALVRYRGFANVSYLLIDPEHRRKRLGWFLTHMCLLRAKANGYIEVHGYIDEDNKVSMALHKKIGFREVV